MTSVVNFDGVIGQDQAKNLIVKARQTEMNILLVGPPGYGKTMIGMRYLQSCVGFSGIFKGGVLELTGSQKTSEIVERIKENIGRPIMIDEAHKMRSAEAIYKYLDKRVGFFKPRSVFALATTDEGGLPDALVSRLLKVALSEYSMLELSKIAALEHEHPNEVLVEIAGLSRGSPRRAKLLSGLLSGSGVGTTQDVRDKLKSFGYPMGLDKREAKMIKTLRRGPTGISTLAGLMGTNNKTVRMVESDLIGAGLVIVSSVGRRLTDAGHDIAKEL